MQAPKPKQPQRHDSDYKRHGTTTYFAARDVKIGKVMGRNAERGTRAEFDELVAMVMGQEPYLSAKRVFWIIDNGPAHCGQAAVERLEKIYGDKLVLVATPVHASWLNQAELYFSVVERKALRGDSFKDTDEVAARLRAFERLHNERAEPFKWTFDRQDLARFCQRLEEGTTSAG